MSKSDTLSDIQPKAVMTAAEVAEWDALPVDIQLARLRAAIDKGITTGVSARTVDAILKGVLARHPNARL